MKKPVACELGDVAAAVVMKKPAAAHAAPAVVDNAKENTQLVALTADDAKDVIGDAKARRAAYGRLATAVANDGRPEVLNIFHGLDEVAKKDTKRQSFLYAWLVDPTFATCIVECKVFTEHLKTSRNDTRLVTTWQLVQAEGQDEADRMIADKLVKPTVDQYGRHVWVYSQELASDERKQGMQTAVNMRMDVDAKTAASISTAMLRDGTGGVDWDLRRVSASLRRVGKAAAANQYRMR